MHQPELAELRDVLDEREGHGHLPRRTASALPACLLLRHFTACKGAGSRHVWCRDRERQSTGGRATAKRRQAGGRQQAAGGDRHRGAKRSETLTDASLAGTGSQTRCHRAARAASDAAGPLSPLPMRSKAHRALGWRAGGVRARLNTKPKQGGSTNGAGSACLRSE